LPELMAFHPKARRPSPPLRRREDGYILLTLLLMVTLMTIAAFAVLPTIAFEIRRDREEEMIHRGVQYSRAIRNYYKKFSRYPTRLENLENTNNLRYLRKRYKDPVNKNRDFKLLHYGDPGLSIGGSFGGGALAGATSVSAMSSSGSSGSAFGGSGSAFGGSASSSTLGGSSSGTFGGGSSSAFGGSFNNSASSGTSNAAGTSNTPGTNSTSGSDSTQASAQVAPGTATDLSSSTQQVVGGLPIVGVVSTSKDTTIREFNHKRKYNEWQFVYDPTMDRGGLLMTPNQPALALGGTPPSQIGQPAGANPSGSSFGQSSFGQSSFGQSSGFGNNNSGLTGGSSTPTPPSNPPQQ
jgi:type II secretory pathway pseudopilin PulG